MRNFDPLRSSECFGRLATMSRPQWDEESHGFGTIRRLADVEPMVIL
jgi:hypothetical protein